MAEELEFQELDLSGEISALSLALSNLQDIDPGLLNKTRQDRLAKMKRQIFDALVYYCGLLPELEENKSGEET